MDLEQAKLILRLHRLLPEESAAGEETRLDDPAARQELVVDLGGGTGVNLSPESVQKALEMTHVNPELAAWYEEEQAIDDAMIDSLLSLEPPASLRDKIMAGAAPHLDDGSDRTPAAASDPSRVLPGGTAAGGRTAISSDRRGSLAPISRNWLALLASVIIAAGLGYFFLVQPMFLQPGAVQLPFATITEEVPRLTESHRHSLPAPAHSLDEVKAFLKSKNAPSEFDVPKGLETFWKLNCEVVDVQGVKVSVVCFKMREGGPVVHLYVMDRSSLKNSPPLGLPELKQMGRYAMASWSDKSKAYILAGPLEPTELMKFMHPADSA